MLAQIISYVDMLHFYCRQKSVFYAKWSTLKNVTGVPGVGLQNRVYCCIINWVATEAGMKNIKHIKQRHRAFIKKNNWPKFPFNFIDLVWKYKMYWYICECEIQQNICICQNSKGLWCYSVICTVVPVL
jgi:hypothetical protein